MSRPPLALTINHAGRTVTVSAAGELDLATAPQLEECLRQLIEEEVTAEVTLDLSQVSFMDSTSISTLIRMRQLAAVSDTTLVLSSPSAPVIRILDIMGITKVFQIRTGPPKAE